LHDGNNANAKKTQHKTGKRNTRMGIFIYENERTKIASVSVLIQNN